MIKINIIKKNDEIKEITFTGHALYADYGKDIVCAGVSSILITTVNAILKYNDKALKYDMKPNVKVQVLINDKIVNILLNNMSDLLKQLANQYQKNIIIREGETN